MVFRDGEGNPMRKSNFIRRDFKPLLPKAGLPDVNFHSLRHSSNSFLIEEGADPLLVAKRNGHSSTRMVLDRYGHLFEGHRRQAAETMDRVFSKATIGRQMVVKPADASEQKKTPIPKKAFRIGANRGGGEETRTPDPLHAKQVLYQLSYTPTGRRRLYGSDPALSKAGVAPERSPVHPGTNGAVPPSARWELLRGAPIPSPMRAEAPIASSVQVAVDVQGVAVRYDRVLALDGVSLTVERGTALGIVGPNGSGKSTLLKTVAGLIKPSAGTVRVFGRGAPATAAGCHRLRAPDRRSGLQFSGQRARRRLDGAVPASRAVRALQRGRQDRR